MDNREFFKILNEFYKGQTMQFIPAPVTITAPPFPYATYQIRDSDSDGVLLDEREETLGKIIEKKVLKRNEELLIKVYDSNDENSYKLALEVLNLIDFTYREKLNNAGFGIIELSEIKPNHEETDDSYIFNYVIVVDIDYNYTITREINRLETLEVQVNEEDKMKI